MKLHLPKLLRVALIAAVMGTSSAYSATLTTDNIAYPNDTPSTPDKEGAAYLDVGMEKTTDTWTGDLVVGDTATTQGDVDYVGTFDSSWNFITPKGGSSNSTITSTLKVTGSLTLQGSGQIMLGGQNSSNYYGLDVANTLTVTGGTLKSTKIIAGNLVVNDGTVSTHTENCTSGNGYVGGVKQSYIKQSLTINGGSLSFGYTANVQGIGTGSHRMTAFGSSASFVMSQTGGTMKVYGDMDMKSGTTINQNAGTMILRDTIYMGFSGTTTISQTGDDAKLVFGRFESTGTTSVCDFEITQSGAGLIHLAYGSNFAGSGTITLNQSGTGSILIGGEHNTSITGALPSRGYALAGSFEAINTTYKLNQTGNGSITVQNHGTVIFEEADIRGSVYTLAGGTIGACFSDLISTTEAPITVEGGNFAMSDGSFLGISFTKECLEGLDASKDKAGTDAKDFDVDLLVVDGDDGATLDVEPDVVLAGMDKRLWHLESVDVSEAGNDVKVEGTLVFTPWIKETDGAESFKDVSSYLKVGLELENKTITLSKSNSHSLGTRIKNSTVTLSNASALGKGPVMTSGTSTVTSSTTAKLPSTIQNSGDLTLKGKFSTTSDSLEQVGESENVLLSLAGQESTDGFAAEKSVHLLVKQEDNSKVTFKSGATVKVNELTYALTQNDNDTVIEGEDVAIAAYTRDKKKYYMNTEGHDITLYEIWQKADNSAVVYMGENAGTLTVNKEYLSVDSKGGKINIASGYAVKGSIENAVVSGDNGTVNADLKGGVTLKGSLSISGTGTTTGALALDEAAVALGAATALGDATLSTTGESSLSTADGVTAGLGATIQNSGQLTLNGSYDATGMEEVLDATHVDITGATGDNGFVRDSGSTIQVVQNLTGDATLAVGADFKVLSGITEYKLDTTTGVATAGAEVHYDTYFISGAEHSVAVDQIQEASGGQTDKVVMSNGSLLVNENMSVEATGGALSVSTGKEVTGSIANAVVSGDNGTVGADLQGGVTLKGSLSISGAGATTGALALDGAAVTLGAATALGDAALSTTGESSLSTADGVTASLGSTIQNSGQLTLNGSYDATGMEVTQLDATHVDVAGALGDDGFVRDSGSTIQVVQNLTGDATLAVGSDCKVGIGETVYNLDTATGVATAGAAIHYDTYFISGAEHSVAVDQIQEASGGQTDKVVMSNGSLLVNENMSVEATGGALSVSTGKEVTGSIANAVVSGDNGTVGADLQGGVTLKGSLSISGAGATTGALALDGAAVTLGAATALGDAALSTTGESSLSTTDGVTASLGSTIQNSGQLTLNGSYDATGMEVTQLDATHVDVAGALGDDGFVRDSGSTVQLVNNNGEEATLAADADFAVSVGGVAGTLDATTGVVTTGAAIHYDTYFISGAEHSVAVDQIQEASGGQTDKVVMSNGSLLVNENMFVEATGGALSVASGKEVTGSIANAVVSGDNGTVGADLQGGVTLKGSLSISGAGATTGALALDGAAVTLGAATALGDAALSTTGESSLSTADGVTASLGSTIQNSGQLTLNGSYDVSQLEAETIGAAYVDADGNVSSDGNGFLRYEGSSVAVISNDAANGASVGQGSGFQILKDGAAGTLDSATGVATFGAGIDYSVYHMVESDALNETVSDILTKGGSDAQVEMSTGKLTADTDVQLNATGGELVTENGTISGSIADTSITANGGEIAADISGDSAVTVTGATTISGENTSEAGLNVNSAALVLGSATALGTGSIATEGTSSIAATEGVTANLGSTIQNSGELTLAGRFDISGLDVQALDATHVDISGATGNNGFVRDSGSSVQVVENVAEGAGLTLGDDISLTIGSKEYVLDAETGVATAGAGTNYGTYYITDTDHSVDVSDIQEVSGNQTTKVVMSDGTLTTDAAMDVATTGGNLNTESGTVTGSIADTSITADGGEIAAAISGESSVTVKGETSLSGDNSYTGDTVIAGEDAKLTVASGSSLGTGKVLLDDHGTLDLGGNAIANDIEVTGCTLAGAGAYSGNLAVSGNLLLQDATTAKSVIMTGKGRISGAGLTTDKLEVATTDNATIGGSLTINENGTLTLNDGKVLTVGGSLTLGNGTSLVLNGDYAAGDKLLTSESGALTLGDVKLVYGDSTVELEVQGGSLVLVSNLAQPEPEPVPVPVFDQQVADSLVLNNWGMLTASRAFVNAVRGQRTNTGCIANGRGTAWVAALGATHKLDGGDIDVNGAVVGADMKVGRRSNLGVAFGYIEGDATPAGLSKVEQEGAYMALYGEHALKKLSATSCLSLDWTAAYSDTESEQGNLSWEQQSVQFDTRLNWNKQIKERLCISVFGGLEYYSNESDTVEGVKTGSIQNLRGEIGVGARYVAWGTPALADGKGGIIRPGCEKLVFTGELRYMNDMVRSNPVVRMNGLSGMGENPGRQGVGIEAGATYRISNRWSASANYGFNTMEGSKEHRVNVGASYTF